MRNFIEYSQVQRIKEGKQTTILPQIWENQEKMRNCIGAETDDSLVNKKNDQKTSLFTPNGKKITVYSKGKNYLVLRGKYIALTLNMKAVYKMQKPAVTKILPQR